LNPVTPPRLSSIVLSLALAACDRSAEREGSAPTPLDPAGLAAVRAREQARAEEETARRQAARPRVERSEREREPEPQQPPPTVAPAQPLAAPQPRVALAPAVDYPVVSQSVALLLAQMQAPTLLALRSADRPMWGRYDHRALLLQRGDVYEGWLRCAVDSRNGFVAVRVPRARIDGLLAPLRAIDVRAERFADDNAPHYSPRHELTLANGRGSVVFVSRGTSDPLVVWGLRLGPTSDTPRGSPAVALPDNAVYAVLQRVRAAVGFRRCDAFTRCMRGKLESRAAILGPVTCPGFTAERPSGFDSDDDFAGDQFTL
jgi:hypothetical protein